MMRFLRGALLATVLAGCTTAPGTINDVHTGIKANHSAYHSAYAGLLENLNVATVIGTQNGVTKYAVSTRYISTMTGWAFFQEAWSFGEKLKFNMTREQLAGCSGGSCTMIEEGVIELTKEQFESAAKSGLEFKLVGKNRSVVAKVPAEAFREALAQ